MYQNNAPQARISVGFTDGSNSDWFCSPCYDPAPEAGQWQNVAISFGGSVSSPGPMAGKTISYFFMGDTQGGPNGEWDVMIADIALVHPNGSVTTFPMPLGSVPYGGDMTDVSSISCASEQVAASSGAVGAISDVHYYVGDHLGTAQMEFASGGYPVWKGDFDPWGQERDTQLTSNNYKFTGKERDAESGLDYFSARYYASNMGRFMSPDPAGVRAIKLANPQTWNWYAYVQNNPLRYTDPTGMYTCADDHNKCATDKDKAFEASRQNDLKSTDKAVVAAAKAYGDPTKDNHVAVGFADRDNGLTNMKVTISGNSVSTQITVTVPNSASGTVLDGLVGHEGVHVEQDQAAGASIRPDGSFDPSLNLSKYDREFPAFQVETTIMQKSGQTVEFNHSSDYILRPTDSPSQVNNMINRFLADPAMGYGLTPQNPGPPLLHKDQ